MAQNNKDMKVFKDLLLSDQKSMFSNLFVWDVENGEKPERKEYKKWVLSFFKNKNEIQLYISDLLSDIDLSKDDPFFYEHNEGYKRQINFLRTLI